VEREAKTALNIRDVFYQHISSMTLYIKTVDPDERFVGRCFVPIT
jgi:hypothetical protein